MKDLSIGADIFWQLAVREASVAKFQLIEIEHILYGMCGIEKVADLGPKASGLGPLESLTRFRITWCPHKNSATCVVAPTGLLLPDVVHRFKSFTTAEYRRGVRQHNWPPFNGKLWQRNYYEHVIRSEEEMNRICEYIIENPAKWTEDENHPAHGICRGEKSFAPTMQSVHAITP